MEITKSAIERFLEVTSATFAYGIFVFGTFASLISVYFLLCSSAWCLVLLYFIWIWVLDIQVSNQCGRDSEWVRNWKIWEYARNYFPIQLECAPDVEFDPAKNYLFCCHPHGISPIAVLIYLINKRKDNEKLTSTHKFYGFTLKSNFMMPFSRELFSAMGFCQVSAESITYTLSKPSGGNAGLLFPGGAAEAYYSNPGKYHLVLKNRKGFIKLALKNGFSIVPLLLFGEVDVFRQVEQAEGSLLRNIQDWVKCIIGVVPIIYFGRSYLPVPYRLPTHIVGMPILVKQEQNPSQGQIDALHEKYTELLTELFEEHKHKYLSNPSSAHLIIH